MKKAILSAVAILGLTGALATANAAPDGGHRGGHGRGHHGNAGQHLARQLDLTDGQKQQWRAEQKSFRLNNAVFLEQLRQTRQDLRAARKAGDTARVDALKATATAQRTQFQQLREAQQQKFVALLTSEQRARFETLKAERAARKAERGDRQRQQNNEQR